MINRRVRRQGTKRNDENMVDESRVKEQRIVTKRVKWWIREKKDQVCSEILKLGMSVRRPLNLVLSWNTDHGTTTSPLLSV